MFSGLSFHIFTQWLWASVVHAICSNAAIRAMFDQRCKCLRPMSFENIRNSVHFLAVSFSFFRYWFCADLRNICLPRPYWSKLRPIVNQCPQLGLPFFLVVQNVFRNHRLAQTGKQRNCSATSIGFREYREFQIGKGRWTFRNYILIR